jgi:hypothetical protein
MNSVEHASRRAHRRVAAAALVVIAVAGAHAWANEEVPKSEHPRKSEVAKRDRHLAAQANKDHGDLRGHYNQIQKQDAAIRKQANADMKANGGHLTNTQQKQLNGEENALHAEINADKGAPPKTRFEQNHPRRAEILHRDNRINGELNADAGKLGGNYGSLEQQQQSIRQQEQTDARANGGYITKAQQQQLSTEETQLNQEVKVDHR